MAKDPLFQPGFYFFSNMYDDSLISSFYRKITSEAYTKSVLYQQDMLSRTRNYNDHKIYYQAYKRDFYIDNKLCNELGLPNDSYIIKFDEFIMPYYNKRKYVSTYGSRHRKVALNDTFSKPDIFNKSVTVEFGAYHFLNAYIVEDNEHVGYLIIPNSETDGISKAHFDTILSEYNDNEPLWIFTEEQTQMYLYNGTVNENISLTPTNGLYDVTIPLMSALNNIDRSLLHQYLNSWDCMITLNRRKYGMNTLVTYPCTFKSIDDINCVFSVDEKFIKYIKSFSNTDVQLAFIHQPNRNHIITYTYSRNTSPIFRLDYDINPSANINIDIYELDIDNSCKGRKLYDPSFNQVYFPNIFDFSTLNVNLTNLIIEVTEYAPSYTNQSMHNSLLPLIDSTGVDFYTEYVTNGYDNDRNGNSLGIKSYKPCHFDLSYNEYASSEYHDDFRGYILDKINKTIDSDPYLLIEYYNWMKTISKTLYTFVGTPKYFKFGTNLSGEFKGSHDIVNDTSNASRTSDDILTFDEPHSYIIYKSKYNEIPSMLYINGKYSRPTTQRFYKGLNYIYYPVSKMETEMGLYSNCKTYWDTTYKEKYNIDLSEDDIALNTNPIVLDFFADSYISYSKSPKDSFTVETSYDLYKIYNIMENPYFSLSELQFYDMATDQYLNLFDYFDIILSVSEYSIKNPGETDKVIISREEDVQYLLTSLNELYCTMDTEPIILSATTVDVDFDDSVNDIVDGWIDNSEISSETDVDLSILQQMLSHKKLNFKNVTLKPKNNQLIGMTVGVYSKSFKEEYIESIDNGTIKDD